MNSLSFQIIANDSKSKARAGTIKTLHGNIETPCLIPVATSASVRSLTSEDLENLKIQCILANTYHLHFQPGDEIIKSHGGLHKFMNWKKPIFTDSGGFQAFSLGLGAVHDIKKIGFFPEERKPSKRQNKLLARVTDKGVLFQSAYDKSYKLFNPEISMKIQSNLGADIIMAFDECTSPMSDYNYTKKSMERTHRWALESIEHHDPKQALYGIIQGGFFKDLREESTKFILSQKFDGIAIGGSLGKSKEDMHSVLDWITPILDDDKRPRHMLGIGWIDDIFECVERGMDTFDCVQMTRLARHGDLYIYPPEGNKKNKFKIEIHKSKYKKDKNPIDKNCSCTTCKNYSRSYLNHLYKAKELSYHKLATIHNIHFVTSLVSQIRSSIISGVFRELKRKWL